MTVKTIAPTAIALALLLSACGAATQSMQARTPTGAHASATAARAANNAGASGAANLPLEYSECMRAHGVRNFPNPVDGHLTLSPSTGINPHSATFQAAANACAAYRPPGGTPADNPPGGPTGATGSKAPAATHAPWSSLAAWLKTQAAAGQFSGSVLVAHADETLLDAGYGLADRSSDTANTLATRFCIASIGKLFTAVAIGQLAQAHKLSFDAPVADYLPELPAAIGQHVTIGELADMTASLGNVVLSRPNPPRTLTGMVALIANEPLQFTPGTRFYYSNDDYILLGAVVQQLSPKPPIRVG